MYTLALLKIDQCLPFSCYSFIKNRFDFQFPSSLLHMTPPHTLPVLKHNTAITVKGIPCYCLMRVHSYELEKLFINQLGTFGQPWCKILNRNAMVHWISLKLCTYTDAIYWPKCKLCLDWNNTLWPFSCISKMMVQKKYKNPCFSSLYYLLSDLMCYILLH